MQNLFWMFDRAGEVDPRDLDARTGFDVRRGPRDCCTCVPGVLPLLPEHDLSSCLIA
jgi:hypothetical protein